MADACYSVTPSWVVEEGVFELDVFTYTTMIRDFCKIGMVHSALKVFDEMCCAPNSVSYNTLIHGFCKNGDLEGAKRVFDRMVEVRGQSCKPDVKGEFREALKCMEEMDHFAARMQVQELL
ncbi:hypothetical protein AHAS_Ahas07G0075900 [Arachis hypogaea]